jgi:hypothetical protein
MTKHFGRQPRGDLPGGRFDACDRCTATTDDGSDVRLLTECGVTGPTRLCNRCHRLHVIHCPACVSRIRAARVGMAV